MANGKTTLQRQLQSFIWNEHRLFASKGAWKNIPSQFHTRLRRMEYKPGFSCRWRWWLKDVEPSFFLLHISMSYLLIWKYIACLYFYLHSHHINLLSCGLFTLVGMGSRLLLLYQQSTARRTHVCMYLFILCVIYCAMQCIHSKITIFRVPSLRLAAE